MYVMKLNEQEKSYILNIFETMLIINDFVKLGYNWYLGKLQRRMQLIFINVNLESI